jgi:hypothetical protein
MIPENYSLAWITLTNGRKDIMYKARPSWYQNLKGKIDIEIIVDDSGSESYRNWLSSEYKSANIIHVDDTASGYINAMSKCFEIAVNSGCDYILHTEDDFILNRDLDVSKLINILEKNKNFAQIALQRQPWYDHERGQDTLIHCWRVLGYEFTEKRLDGCAYVEHAYFWTANPNIYPTKIASIGWPKERDSELQFTKKVFALGYKAAFYEKESSENYVTHIGDFRLGGNH